MGIGRMTRRAKQRGKQQAAGVRKYLRQREIDERTIDEVPYACYYVINLREVF